MQTIYFVLKAHIFFVPPNFILFVLGKTALTVLPIFLFVNLRQQSKVWYSDYYVRTQHIRFQNDFCELNEQDKLYLLRLTESEYNKHHK